MGAWGVFGIGFIDSALFGMPLDAVVGTYVYQKPRLAWLYIIMASAGSALGSVVIYWIGHKGGELLLERRFGRARMERLRDRFERHEFLALAFPSMLPPPTPFKMFLLAAAVFQMHLRDFLLAIFVGRLVRFTILTGLVLWLGPQAISIVGGLLHDHLVVTLVALISLVVAIALWWVVRRKPNKN